MAAWSRPRASERAHGVRERHGQRAAGKLGVRDARFDADPRARRHDLAVERAADDGHAFEALVELVRLLGVEHRVLQRRVWQLHDVRIGLGAEVEPTREVRVEDVEAP